MRLFLLIIICASAINTFSQVEISGNVRDKNSGNSLYPATVYLTQNGKIKAGTVSDDQGYFRLDGINSGDYILQVDFPGYHSIKLPVEAGNTDMADLLILMEVNEYFYLGTPIEITENPYKSGDLTMTQQQYKVMPASFQDPSRVLLRYPGFSTDNDGANGIVFRGMPPEYTRWQLYGVDIVNPNHLSNAGTASDEATANAGGVNALSGSILDYYHFEANPADISYANVLSGVSDMKMAPRIRSFVDINFIGLESGLNFNNKNKESRFFKNVYAAYRYSFTGLLSNLGVDFGNEKIGYQDLALNAEIYQDNHRSIRVFGVLGKSSNVFKAVTDISEVSRFKDFQNIRFTNNLAIGGLQHMYQKGELSIINTIAVSARKSERDEATDEKYDASLSFLPSTFYSERKENLISTHNAVSLSDEKSSWAIGLRVNYSFNSIFEEDVVSLSLPTDNYSYFNDHDNVMLYPYLSYMQTINDKFKINAGIATTYNIGANTFNSVIALRDIPEPYLNLSYTTGKASGLEFKYRRSRARDHIENYLFDYQRGLYDVRGHNVQLKYFWNQWNFQFLTQAFYHYFTGFDNHSYTFFPPEVVHLHDFNGELGGFYSRKLRLYPLFNYSANARSYGFETYVMKKIQWTDQSLSATGNATIFRSAYQLDGGGAYFDSRYNFGQIFNAMLTYEKRKRKEDKIRNFMLSAAWHFRGGQRQPALLPLEEVLKWNRYPDNIFDVESPLTGRLQSYQRLDLRIVYFRQREGSRFTHRWSLDIQNVLNRLNDGFNYFDMYLYSYQMQPQLGLVPVLSYRLEW
jgi:hypothetical protein